MSLHGGASSGIVAGAAAPSGGTSAPALATGRNKGIFVDNNSAVGLYGLGGANGGVRAWLDKGANAVAGNALDDGQGGMVFAGGARVTSGSGAPSTPGGANPTAGDVYHRTDTPTTANQRIYICTVGGGTPTWVGIA